VRRARRFPLPRRTVAVRTAVALILLGLAAWQFFVVGEPDRPAPLEPGAIVLVERVIDGDTLLLADQTRIRLLGVDTPETKRPDSPIEPFGPEAYAFTRLHVEGRLVRLEFDKERYDRYGRVLAYVYLGDWFLNEELIRAGMGRAITGYPFSESMKRRFRKAQAAAQESHVGIWSQGKRADESPRRKF